jgi:hypothetical protein
MESTVGHSLLHYFREVRNGLVLLLVVLLPFEDEL